MSERVSLTFPFSVHLSLFLSLSLQAIENYTYATEMDPKNREYTLCQTHDTQIDATAVAHSDLHRLSVIRHLHDEPISLLRVDEELG